jgi:TetR/AcrR family transcriptional regulator
MGISERRKREREWRKKEILDAAEALFFSGPYEDVSMDAIAERAELNKATIYLYFKNKETLFAAVVLCGVRILLGRYTECAETQVPGMNKVALIGRAYYRFTQEHPEYTRLIHTYASRNFSDDNPCAVEIHEDFRKCRMLLQDAIREGMADGTIRNDLDPFLIAMFLMITFQGILSVEEKWKQLIAEEGFSHTDFIRAYTRFITPAVSTGEKPHTVQLGGSAGSGPFSSLFFGADPLPVDPIKKKKTP